MAQSGTHLGGDDNELQAPANVDGWFGRTVDIVRDIMGKDLNPHEDLLVLEINGQKQTVMHNMNRWDLLMRCRRLIVEQQPPSSDSASRSHRSDFFRTSALVLNPNDSPDNGGHLRTSKMLTAMKKSKLMLQFRDMRCLQGITEPVIHVRKGALVVSLDPIRAVITCSNMFVVLRDGQDSELQPLMLRLRSHEAPYVSGVGGARQLPFELQALDAVLYTCFYWHLERVRECSNRAAVMINTVQRALNDEVLFQILTLERAMHSELESLQGLANALDEPQNDPQLMAGMCLTHLSLIHSSTAAATTTTNGDDSVASGKGPSEDAALDIGSTLQHRYVEVERNAQGRLDIDVCREGAGQWVGAKGRLQYRIRPLRLDGSAQRTNSRHEPGGLIQEGALLVEIDGHKAAELDVAQLRGLMDGRPHSRASLVFCTPSDDSEFVQGRGDSLALGEARRRGRLDDGRAGPMAEGWGEGRGGGGGSEVGRRRGGRGVGVQEEWKDESAGECEMLLDTYCTSTAECEMLLDTYCTVFEGLLVHLRADERQLAASKALVGIQLKVRRNRIVHADMRFEVGTYLISVGFLASSVFGQNLHTGLGGYKNWEGGGSSWPFAVVAGSILALGMCLGLCSVVILRHFLNR